MFRQRGLRLVLLALVAVLSIGALAGPAKASDTTTRITIHARICPTSGVYDFFDDCHGNPMTGQAFRVTGRTSKYVSATTGNVSFNQLTPGSYVVALSAGDQPNEFLQLRAFCSDANVGGWAYEVRVRSTAQASFRVNAYAGQNVVCDVYWIPESGA